jgi:hypothetical protein
LNKLIIYFPAVLEVDGCSAVWTHDLGHISHQQIRGSGKDINVGVKETLPSEFGSRFGFYETIRELSLSKRST